MQERRTRQSDRELGNSYPPRSHTHRKKKKRKPSASVSQPDNQTTSRQKVSKSDHSQASPVTKKKRGPWQSFLNVASAALLLAVTIGIGWLVFTPAGEAFRSRTADKIIGTPNQQWAKFLIGSSETERRIKLFNTRMNSELTE